MSIPHTVHEVRVIIKVHIKTVTVDVVQNFVAVLEVIEHAQNGAVVVVRSQWR